MQPFNEHLAAELARIRGANLFRSLRQIDSPQGARVSLEGRGYLNFSSNDYLGLANHPAVAEAAASAARAHGAGTGASRLICGSLKPQHELEEALARFKGTEAALAFSSGYSTAIGAIPALVGKGDWVILDRLAHASLVDGARLSGAQLRVFPHNDAEALEAILRKRPEGSRALVVTESVFSMDGDTAPLAELTEVKDRHGAWLMVDEAHATGLYGPCRGGLVQALGLTGRVEVQMGTLGKSLGSAGGFIAGSRALIDLLVNRARSLIFSTAPVPAAAAAAIEALKIVSRAEGEELNRRLWANVAALSEGLGKDPCASPIFPVILGTEERALKAAGELADCGMLAPAIRPPTVKRGQARLRITVSAQHQLSEIQKLAASLKKWVDTQPR